MGHLGVGIQRPRRADELPIPGLRRAGPRAEARAGRRHRDRALRQRVGPSCRTTGRLRQPPSHRRGRRPGHVRLHRGDRLHPLPTRARQHRHHAGRGRRRRWPVWRQRWLRRRCSGAAVHGAPPGDEPARLRIRAARRADATAIPVRSGAQVRDLAPAGADPEADGHGLTPHRRGGRRPRHPVPAARRNGRRGCCTSSPAAVPRRNAHTPSASRLSRPTA